jgi:hypothetical protein
MWAAAHFFGAGEKFHARRAAAAEALGFLKQAFNEGTAGVLRKK